MRTHVDPLLSNSPPSATPRGPTAPDFTGRLDTVDLRTLIRLLTNLDKTGRLDVDAGDWKGHVFFQDGQVIAAGLATERGLAALEAMLLVLDHGAFGFHEGATPVESNVQLARDRLLEQLDRTAERSRGHVAIPAAAVPHVVESIGDDHIALNRAALRLLLTIDGERTVYQLSTRLGIADTVANLATLVELGLIQIGTGPSLATPAPPLAWPERLQRRAHAVWLVQPMRRLVPVAALGLIPALILGLAAVLSTGVPNHAGPRAASTPTSAPLSAAQVEGTAVEALPPTAEPVATPTPGFARLATPDPTGVADVPAVAVPTTSAPPIVVTDEGPGAMLALQQRTGATPPAAWEALALGPASPGGMGARLGRSWTIVQPYRLLADAPGKFVAIGGPLPKPLGDTSVWASLRKVAGPSGGGYGLIVRDQGPEPRDGINQIGQFYVFEVSDAGQLGIWRRDMDHWRDLLTWSPSAAVRTGSESNVLRVDAFGDHFTFFVNGIQVADGTDATLASGQVGVFAGGDMDEAVLEGFVVAST